MNEFNRTRAKILGVLIRDARLYAGRSLEDCAAVLGVTAEEVKQAEMGEHILSLPELETLAMYLDVPLSHFWGDKTIGQPHRTDYEQVMQARHGRIGDLLKQARENEGRTVQDLAQELRISPTRIREYESGETSIPLFQLDHLARYLGHSLNYFMDDDEGSLLAQHEAEQRVKQRFEELPEEMQQFVTEPINLSYLEIALRLSKMDVQSLRAVAENILNITF